MLQLCKHGPEIPLEVCAALEEEKLVLFCGAGVSVYSGLPLFAGLVDEVYKKTAEVRNAPEERAFHDKQYDKVLGLLEERLVKGVVRGAVREVLTAPAPGPLSTHEDVLELSRIRGGYRLVTTNFDRRFLEAGGLNETQVWRAPALTLPKDYSWRTVVHLHGVISDDARTGPTWCSPPRTSVGRTWRRVGLPGSWSSSFASSRFCSSATPSTTL